jgi:hypothetical protein
VIDKMILDLDMVKCPTEFTDEIVARLVQEAEGFLRAGGEVSWEFWVGLSVDTRAAFICAGDRIRREQAVAIGLASSSTKTAAAMLEELDGGDAQIRMALNEALNHAQRRLDPARKEMELTP